MRLYVISIILKLLVCSSLFSQYQPVGFEDLKLGMSPSEVVRVRPNAAALSVAPESTDSNKADQDIDSVEALMEVVPNGAPSHVMFKFIDSSLSSSTYVYSQNGKNTLLELFEANGSYQRIEPSAEKNRAMVKWSLPEGINAYLTIPLELNLDKDFSVIYQVMSKAEVEQFESYRDSSIESDEFNTKSALLGKTLGSLMEPESTSSSEFAESTPKVTKKITSPKPATKEPAEVAPVEVVEETPEQSSQWWLWLVGALVVIGGLGLVLRRKS